MEEQEELKQRLLNEAMLELAPYVPAVCKDFVRNSLERLLLTAIHKAYILGGRECLKNIKG